MKAYNPLEKRNLAESVVNELLEVPISPLEALSSFEGAGVYVIYYTGDFELYSHYKNDIENGVFDKPIYVGKASPKGSRKGGDFDAAPGQALYNRLKKHLASLRYANNLDSHDFYFRYLVVDDIWVPLGEALLISKYRPIWNVTIEGFGINAPGNGREAQKRSQWDTLHPGRPYAANLAPAILSQEQILANLAETDKSTQENDLET